MIDASRVDRLGSPINKGSYRLWWVDLPPDFQLCRSCWRSRNQPSYWLALVSLEANILKLEALVLPYVSHVRILAARYSEPVKSIPLFTMAFAGGVPFIHILDSFTMEDPIKSYLLPPHQHDPTKIMWLVRVPLQITKEMPPSFQESLFAIQQSTSIAYASLRRLRALYEEALVSCSLRRKREVCIIRGIRSTTGT